MVVETKVLIDSIKKMYPVSNFFKDRYFPDGKCYYSEKAMIETKKQGRKVAPFVIPVVGGVVMDHEGYRAYEVDAPYIAPKMPITAQELALKAFGESPESGRSPESRQNEVQAEHMDDLRNAIFRRQELMCADIITSGKIVMKHYATADDAANDTNYQTKILQFYENEFKNHYYSTIAWSSMTMQQKIQWFYGASKILRQRGVRATDLVMTSDVSAELLSDLDFLEYYNKIRVDVGAINPAELPDGVVNNGTINLNGVLMTMYSYDEQFEDLDGTIREFLPAGTIAFLHPGMGTTVYAQVTFVEDGGFKSYAERIVPRVLDDKKNNIVEVQTFSRPVSYPIDWDGWLVANTGDAAKTQTEVDNAVDTHEAATAASSALKTADEIDAMTSKATVIAYATSIGLSGLTTDLTLKELKEATKKYQAETY